MFFVSLLFCATPVVGMPIALPVRVDEHRFILEPKLASGETLSFYTDSGGGMVALFKKTAQRLGLKTHVQTTSEGSFDLTPWPAFDPDAAIPTSMERPELLVCETPKQFNEAFDGFLGHPWFGGRVWTFDYPGKRLLWRAPGDLPAHKPAQRMALGFQTDKKGERQNNFPRMQVTIDGEAIDFLLDTGATTTLSERALKVLADGRPASRAASFITERTFRKWHEKHPTWRVIEKAEVGSGATLIEVPTCTVAGLHGGPVWFTVRANENFTEYMSSMMDKPIEGAFGGSGLYPFSVTVDYVNAVAVFASAPAH